MAGLDAHSPTREAPDHLIVGDLDQDRCGDVALQLRELLVERLRLIDRARKPVQDEAVLGVRLTEPLRDHGNDQLVRDELALIHVFLGLLAELGAVLDVGSQHVSGGDERKPKVDSEPIGLRSLPCSRRTEQDQV